MRMCEKMPIYYDHVCACGCLGLIEIHPYHKYYGVPRYINGHQNIGRKLGPPSPEALVNLIIAANRPERIEQSRLANQGRKHTPEEIAKIKAAQTTPEALERARVIATTPEALARSRKTGKANKGRKQSSEHIEKRSGDKSSNWKGGISFEPYSPEFSEARKRQVREWDGHICQCCGRTREEEGKELAVHHIDHDKQNCSDDNLITLCGRCNGKANGSAVNRYVYMRVFQQRMSVGSCRR